MRKSIFTVLAVTLLFGWGVSAQVVDIPDANLHAAIAEALNKAPGDTITRADMETLLELQAPFSEITDLRGIEFAINLTYLGLWDNSISDISALSSLTKLTYLGLWRNTISDISPLSNLTNLTLLYLTDNSISDISPVARLTNLTSLWLWGNTISDISPLSNLTNLTSLWLSGNSISDISPLSVLTNLTYLNLQNNTITDISPLSSLTNLTELYLGGNAISDISPLSSLANLTVLYLWDNAISDISPLSSLANLTVLYLPNNTITDISPLIGLINLEVLRLAENPIEDLSPLYTLLTLNPGLDVDIPSIDKITGPWLWMIAPTEPGQGGAASTDIDSLSVASGGAVTEADVARNGANIGDSVGNYAWTPAEIAAAEDDTESGNVNDVVNRIGFAQGDVDDHSAYALITLEAVTAESGVIMKVGSDDSIKVWLNGEVVHTNAINRGSSDFQDTFLVDLATGENLLLAKVSERLEAWDMFVGIDADLSVVLPPEPDSDSLDVNGDGQITVVDLAIVALFYGTRVPVGVSLAADVNADGVVDLADLTAVAEGIDAAGNSRLLNADDVAVVLEAVAEQVNVIEGIAEAPAHFSTSQQAGFSGVAYQNVAAAFADVKHLANADVRLGKWVPMLKELLHRLTEMREIPDTTALLPNYPNPFNPETWIPYHLSKDTEVIVTIYDVRGVSVRELTLGYQAAGIYESRARAAYWDGRNQHGEPVASGLYFYTLTAGDFTATRKLLIAK